MIPFYVISELMNVNRFQTYALTFFIILTLIVISVANFFGSTESQISPTPGSYDSTIARKTGSRAGSDLVFQFPDERNDVKLTENRLEDYSAKQGFDIESISTELSGEILWLNMTMYDFVAESDEIYYRLEAGPVEVLFFKSDGSISYPDGSSEFAVTSTTKMISAELDVNKFSSDNFEIYGRSYQEGSDGTHGDFIIFDEVDGAPNGLELSYDDAKDDIQLAYRSARLVQDQPGLDIESSKMIDSGNNLKVTVTFNGDLQNSPSVIYKIILGKATFEYTSGTGYLEYIGMNKDSINVEKTSKSISVTFDKSKLDLWDKHLLVSARDEISEDKVSVDEQFSELPSYLFASGEKMDVEITMFDNNDLIMSIQGDLNLTNTVNMRYHIDQKGNRNNKVESSEVTTFLEMFYINHSVYDFFFFQPYVNSIPGQGTYEIEITNLEGDVNDFSAVSLSIISHWHYMLTSEQKHDIAFRLFSSTTPSWEGLGFVFDIIYDKLTIKIASEFKYWELDFNSTYPDFMGDYISVVDNAVILPDLKYYELENSLEVPEFGLTIRYNETLAAQDKPKDDDDSDGGFLPGFELELLVICTMLAILFYVKEKRKYK
jgi:hypothetical protein